MKAWLLNNGKIEIKNVEKPTLLKDEVLIKTKAISLNPVDYKITKGAFGLSTPRVIGIDVAGYIEEIGENCDNSLLGKKIIALVNMFETGSFAEYVKVNKNVISEIPDGISYEEASTIPCAGITAYQAIKEKINLRENQTIFITVGNGSVGKFAIQLAKLEKAKVITTASIESEKLIDLGADYVMDYKNENIHKKIYELTNNKGVDYIVDLLSSDNILNHAELLRFNGTIIGITGIPNEYPYPAFSKAAGLIEVALGGAYRGGDIDSLKEISQAGNILLDLLKNKKIKIDIAKIIKFDEIDSYLNSFGSKSLNGKIVVRL